MTVRVVVVDDETLVRAGFRVLLESENDLQVVGEAADGTEAVRVIRELRPDVALMDIRMPGINGIEAIRTLFGGPSPVPVHVLVLTTFDLDEYVFEALRAGAAGFLLKDTPPARLIARSPSPRSRRRAGMPWESYVRCWEPDLVVVQTALTLGDLERLLHRPPRRSNLDQVFQPGSDRAVADVVGALGRVADTTSGQDPVAEAVLPDWADRDHPFFFSSGAIKPPR